MNSTEVLPVRDTHFQGYSFGNWHHYSIYYNKWTKWIHQGKDLKKWNELINTGSQRIKEIDWTGALIKGRNMIWCNIVWVGNIRREWGELLCIHVA